MPGERAGRRLEKKRQEARWRSTDYKRKKLKLRQKTDPMKGSPQARGIVLKKVAVEAKQPNSGLRKCIRVQLIGTGNKITAFAPGENAITFIEEHDTVLVEKLRGSKRGTLGDLPGVRWKVIKVNSVPLEMMRRGKREKPQR